MSDREFDNYLALLSGMLRLRRTQREGIAGELRDHLIENVAQLEASGSTHEEAVRRALEEFGDAAALAANFQALVGMRRRRLVMRCTIGTTVVMTGLVVGLLAFRPEVRNDATIVQAQEGPKTAESSPEKPALEPKKIGVADKVATSHYDAANAATRSKLDKLIDVNMTETPLQEALKYFSKKVGVQFYLDPKALTDLGITPDDPVTLTLDQVPAEMAFDLALRPHQLAYTLRGGVVMVSSQAEIDAQPETRVYYVPNDAAEELAQLIPSTIVPTTWDTVGGLGCLRVFRDSLVISQTWEAHQKIEKLLKDLEPVLAKGPRKVAVDEADGRYGAVGGGYGSAGGGSYGATSGYGRGGYGATGAKAGYGPTGRNSAYGANAQPGYGQTLYQPLKPDTKRAADPAPSAETKTPSAGEPAATKEASPAEPAEDASVPK